MAEVTSTPPPFKVLTVFPRVWKLMTKREKQKSGVLFIGTILNSFVEILGLAAVVPVIGLVIEPQLIRTNEYLGQAFEWSSILGIDSERKFLMLTSVLLVAAFLFKAIFNLGLNLFQTRFSLGIGHRISGLMWDYHFSQSLVRMRTQESGQVMSEIGGWPNNLADKFIVGGMRLINELLVIVIIAIGLIAYQPIVLISVSALLTIGALIIRTGTKNRLDAYSQISRIVGPQTGTLLNNAIKGFLELITFRASDAVRNEFLRKRLILIRIASNSQIMGMAPSKLYEVLAVTAVSASIFLSLLLGNSNEQFLNLLIVMALSAYRIMPSMTRINGQMMAMRQNKYVLDVIEASLSRLAHMQAQDPLPEVKMADIDIEIEDLTVGYEALTAPILENFSMVFPSHSVNAIVGPSGSGKTTLVNTILGLHQPETGTICAAHSTGAKDEVGKDVSLHSWLGHVGYLSQQPYFFNGSVRDNLTMLIPGQTLDESTIEQLINKLDLEDCLGESPLDFELLEGGNNLSGGQQQRLAILRALRTTRPVLILDEATSALDHAKRDAVIDLLKARAQKGANVLIITHDMELAKQCDTILDLGIMKKK